MNDKQLRKAQAEMRELAEPSTEKVKATFEMGPTTIEEILLGQKVLIDLIRINQLVDRQVREGFGRELDVRGLCEYFGLGDVEKVHGFWFLILAELKAKLESNKTRATPTEQNLADFEKRVNGDAPTV